MQTCLSQHCGQFSMCNHTHGITDGLITSVVSGLLTCGISNFILVYHKYYYMLSGSLSSLPYYSFLIIFWLGIDCKIANCEFF